MSFQMTRAELMISIGDHLGLKRSGWDTTETARLEEIVKSGAQQFYWPPPLPKERVAHRWTFLQPLGSIRTRSGQGDYALPEDFGSLVQGRLYYSVDDNKWHPILDTSIGRILGLRQKNTADGAPRTAAVVPRASEGRQPQRWNLALAPTPDAAYTIGFQYQVTPETVDASHTYHLGGAIHSETLLASCLAVAERRYGDAAGEQEEYWLQRLAASVSHDRALAPAYLGYNGDSPGSPMGSGRVNSVTFAGVAYD